ncbi:MAG: DUF4253 domain-containing protein [Clostridiales bacterium]|nr:DUF4253 domain-containing protein [Clostridiales bacterium]
MSEESKMIIDFLNCDYELYYSDEGINKIIDRFASLSDQGKASGYYPVLLVSSDTLVEMFEIVIEDIGDSKPESIAAYRDSTIAAAAEIDGEQYLNEIWTEGLEEYSDFDITGDFLHSTDPADLQSYLQFVLGTYSEEILIALIPTTNPWELAAWIPMGGFNDCPAPENQVAVFRYWYDKYDAVPILATFDTWMMTLANPPETDEEAEALAKEQFTFCSDIVLQGTETIRALASGLKNSTVWYFWWD